MCGRKAAQMHGQPLGATKEPVQPLAAQYFFLLYDKKILISRHLSSMPTTEKLVQNRSRPPILDRPGQTQDLYSDV